jgi:hypothetical protein
MKSKNIIVRDFPAELHTEFKSLCALQPVPMNRKIIDLVTAWVSEHHDMIRRVTDFNKK